MKCSVYILYSEKFNKYYVGVSENPEIRLTYHNLGKKGWTKSGIPWKLVFKKEYPNRKTALAKERFIKRQKSRNFMEKLISGDYVL